MTDIYLTTSLSTHNGDDTPQNYEQSTELCTEIYKILKQEIINII